MGVCNVHLLAAMDESLLNRRDTLLLLDLLLDLGDLKAVSTSPFYLVHSNYEAPVQYYLVIRLNIELDLLAGQCSDPVESQS